MGGGLTRIKRASGVLIGTMVGIAAASFCLQVLSWRHGSLQNFVAWLRGDPVVVSVRNVKAEPGETVLVPLRLTNLRRQHIVVEGVETTCTCVSLDTLPVVVSPKSTVSLQFEVHVRDNAKRPYREHVVLYISPDVGRLVVALPIGVAGGG